jgi:hypothetical protein
VSARNSSLSNGCFLALAAGWFAVVGCSKPPVGEIDRPRLDYLCWSKNLRWGNAEWLEEARTRFKDPFVFTVHGNTNRPDWRIAPDKKYVNADIECVGWLLHSLMPDRDVVLISCNSDGRKPRLPRRVWYADRTVAARPWWAWELGPPFPDDVGCIWQFQEGTEK